MERLVNGPWNGEDFLTLKPGFCVKANYDDAIVTVCPCRPDDPSA